MAHAMYVHINTLLRSAPSNGKKQPFRRSRGGGNTCKSIMALRTLYKQYSHIVEWKTEPFRCVRLFSENVRHKRRYFKYSGIFFFIEHRPRKTFNLIAQSFLNFTYIHAHIRTVHYGVASKNPIVNHGQTPETKIDFLNSISTCRDR